MSNSPIRTYKKKYRKPKFEGAWVVLLLAVVVGIICLFIMSLLKVGFFKDRPDGEVTTSAEEQTGTVTEEETTVAVTTQKKTEIPKFDYEEITVNNSLLHVGNLLLINDEHEYVFPTDWKTYDIDKLTKAQREELGDFTGLDNKDKIIVSVMMTDYDGYKLRNKWRMLRLDTTLALNDMMKDFSTKTGVKNAMLYSTYRAYEDQQSLYDQYPNSAARPGCSDYHLGTTFSFGLLNGDGTQEDTFITRLNGTQAKWLKTNMANYGFIMRYPSYSYQITGYSIPDQLRYVGVEHATYIMTNGICLEEYLQDMRETYLFDSPLLIDCADGFEYIVYFVPMSEGSTTEVKVPVGPEYKISGNNVDGFIVSFPAAEIGEE